MAFCPSCGTAVTDAQFCPKCGTNVSTGASGTTPLRVSSSGLTNNVASALCYVVPLIGGIVFLVLEPYKNDRKVRFDAFQGIFLAILLMVIGYIIEVVLVQVSYGLFGMVHALYRLGSLLLWLFLAFKAFQNEKTVLPVIGPLAEKQAGAI
ncbi:MAG: hypothetical protein M3Z36_01445 [Acidobacteriota bacterium]|nr:hypothetical protein [Acidobacteriota bacterium]